LFSGKIKRKIALAGRGKRVFVKVIFVE